MSLGGRDVVAKTHININDYKCLSISKWLNAINLYKILFLPAMVSHIPNGLTPKNPDYQGLLNGSTSRASPRLGGRVGLGSIYIISYWS